MLNDTFIKNCTYSTCSVEEYGQIQYIPSIDGNGLYLGLFSIFFMCQCYLGIRYRTWGYLAGMFGGLVLEIVGYVARIQLHFDVFDQNVFTIYLIGTTIGPAFFSASIYLSLARIIPVFGADLMPFASRTITFAFMFCDFVSLLLQAIGGAMTATANRPDTLQIGIDIMIAGLASQVASMSCFVVLCLQFTWNIRKSPSRINTSHKDLRNSSKFQRFLSTLAIATVTILIRCCFRVAELHAGFDGSLANNEVLYMVFEGAMMTTAVGALTIGHPGPAIGSLWRENGFQFRERKTVSKTTVVEGGQKSVVDACV